MSIEDLPLIEQVFESGAHDRIFDALLLAGPGVLVLLAILGRSLLTVAIAAAYVATFLVHVIDNAVE